MGTEFKAAMALFASAFGIVVPMPAFLAGMFLGLGACYGVMIFTPPKDRKSLWATLFVGFVVTLLAAIAYPNVSWINWLPLQVVMAVAGGLSRPITESFISLGHGLIKRARELPSEWKLPGSSGGENDRSD